MNLRTVLKQAYDAGARAYLAPMFRREADHAPDQINEGAVQYQFALRALTDAQAHDVLDVGTGLSAWPKLLSDCGFRVTAIDEFTRYWGDAPPFNRHFPIEREDITNPSMERTFDALTCLNVMMAIDDDDAALTGMLRLVRADGLVVLSFPYNERRSIDNIYALPQAGYGQDFRFRCRVRARMDLDGWLAKFPVRLVQQECYRMFTGELWTFGKRLPPERVPPDQPHHFTAVLLQKRAR